MPQMTDKLKGCYQNSYNSIKKKKNLLMTGGVFNILLNIHGLTGINIDGLGLVFNRS